MFDKRWRSCSASLTEKKVLLVMYVLFRCEINYFTVSILRYVIKSDRVLMFSAGCLQSIYAGTNKATAAGNSTGGD